MRACTRPQHRYVMRVNPTTGVLGEAWELYGAHWKRLLTHLLDRLRGFCQACSCMKTVVPLLPPPHPPVGNQKGGISSFPGKRCSCGGRSIAYERARLWEGFGLDRVGVAHGPPLRVRIQVAQASHLGPVVVARLILHIHRELIRPWAVHTGSPLPEGGLNSSTSVEPAPVR